MRLFSLSHQDHHFHEVNRNLAETAVNLMLYDEPCCRFIQLEVDGSVDRSRVALWRLYKLMVSCFCISPWLYDDGQP